MGQWRSAHVLPKTVNEHMARINDISANVVFTFCITESGMKQCKDRFVEADKCFH